MVGTGGYSTDKSLIYEDLRASARPSAEPIGYGLFEVVDEWKRRSWAKTALTTFETERLSAELSDPIFDFDPGTVSSGRN